ncbi:unnamed protein product, partial [marine sediment metagenome]
MGQNRFNNRTGLWALVDVAAGVVCVSMLANCLWAAEKDSQPVDKKGEFQ